MKNFKKILFVLIFVFALGACQGNNPAPQETWKLVKLVTAGEESQNVITEVVTVRNCGIPEHKGVECSAGTTNDLSISLGGSLGYEAGFSGSVTTSVSTGLGIGRTSGESLDLDEPANNKIYQYAIDKVYKVLVGDALAQSSNGNEQTATYIFNASCTLAIKSREELSCNQAQPSPQSQTTSSTIYDNFDNPKYNGSIDDRLWTKWSDVPSSAQAVQQDGILVFSDKGSSGNGLILFSGNWQKSKFGFFEAKLKMDSQNSTNGGITINAFSSELPSGWTEMGIIHTGNSSKLEIQVNGKIVVSQKVNNDTWYTLRLEYDDSKNEIRYLLDGIQVASYTIPNKVSKITTGIQLWHPNGSSITGYIDDVSIGD